ncbi:MFS transporter [Amycolatopsis saalfeldensis]|uniref:MFS transporter, DHA1 family, arabinose polymer transporter n=1 Tax=Amycolatopsis saalfeldensis TaxID=394193 RepID=A0A1H8VHM5_9PSEU|nr:MFS transporter [Amycolatopsis saalfeldensis]SEP14388.1 MFS transporter, DHA1 family, arabinose polymer transporter [Amycolatopsis saalfeldensis]
MPPALFALALGAFGIGATEFAMMGVLPAVADGMHVSIPQAGYLITGYALGVVIGAPLLTAVSGRFRRKHLLLGMMVIFTVGNFAAAAATGYGWLMAARVLTALPHGAFFGVGSVVATGLAGKGREARAISLMFTGLTVANIVGVPAATALGNAVSWRLAFALIGVLGLLAVLGIVLLVPSDPVHSPVRLRAELRAFTRPAVLLTLAVGTFGFAGVFATYSYITPTLTSLAGAGPIGLAVALALFGLGSSAGNLAGGRLADRALLPATYVALGALAVALALFALAVHNEVTALVTVGVIGLASGLVIPPVQLRIIRAAGEAPTLAAASVQSGFNIANAGGAALGGALIGAGFGYTAPSLAGAALALTGLVLAGVSSRWERVNAKTAGVRG